MAKLHRRALTHIGKEGYREIPLAAPCQSIEVFPTKWAFIEMKIMLNILINCHCFAPAVP